MKPDKVLLDKLYWEEVERAKAMSPEEKFLAGEILFNYACSITLAGIRNQFPKYTDDQCMDELKRRLALREKLEGGAHGH